MRSEQVVNEELCSICLGQISNKCQTDSCGHAFCLSCLKSWSNEHNFCPLCRQAYDNIQHNFRFDTIRVRNRQTSARQKLFAKRKNLRERMVRNERDIDDYMKDLHKSVTKGERIRDQIRQQICEIDSIDRQNNEDFERSLDEIRNAFNAIDVERHSLLQQNSLSMATGPQASGITGTGRTTRSSRRRNTG